MGRCVVWRKVRWIGSRDRKRGIHVWMSCAVNKGLYHPQCKASHTTCFPGISTADDTWTKKELEDICLQAKKEAKQQYAERQAEKYDRLAKYSLDEENRDKYGLKAKQWRHVRFRTGEYDAKEYENEKRIESFFGTPLDVTSAWTTDIKQTGSIIKILEYAVNGDVYKVDGKHVVLDYSENEKKDC